MKIKDLFSRKRPFPYLTAVIVCICFIVTTIAVIFPAAFPILAWKCPADHFWQYFSGVFLHGTNTSASMAYIHLTANLLMFAPYAVMAEKALGHLKFGIVFAASWLGGSIAFRAVALLFSKGEPSLGAGLSGIAFTFIVVGVSILYRVFKLDKKAFFRQPLAYFFLFGLIGELAVLNPYIAGMGSFILHTCGVLVGLLMAVLFRHHFVLLSDAD